MKLCITLTTEKYAKLKQGESVLITLSSPLLDDRDEIGVKETFFDDVKESIDCGVVCLESGKYVLLPKVDIKIEQPIWVRECVIQKQAS